MLIFYRNNENQDKDAGEEEEQEQEKEAAEPKPIIKSEKKSIFPRPSISNNAIPRSRYRNFSHISEFGSGLDMPTKSHKKRDKIDEFLEKKRERNTSKRLFGRKKKFD